MQLPLDHHAVVQGHHVRYWEEGSGTPVVLVHGLGNSVINWRKNVGPLSQHFRVIALDLPGHGLSQMPRSPFDLSHGAAFLSTFLDTLAIPEAHLVGNSMGGILALELSLSRPRRISSLTLVDSAGLGREIALALRIAALPLIGEYLHRPTPNRVRRLVRWMLYDPRHIEVEDLHLRYTYLRRQGSAQALVHYLRTGVGPTGQRSEIRRDSSLSSLTQPALIIWGAQDPLFPPMHGERSAHQIPDSRLHIFNHCGHWPHYEYADDFNELLTGFLKAVASPVAHRQTVTVP